MAAYCVAVSPVQFGWNHLRQSSQAMPVATDLEQPLLPQMTAVVGADVSIIKVKGSVGIWNQVLRTSGVDRGITQNVSTLKNKTKH